LEQGIVVGHSTVQSLDFGIAIRHSVVQPLDFGIAIRYSTFEMLNPKIPASDFGVQLLSFGFCPKLPR
jgi:hypothetical protein